MSKYTLKDQVVRTGLSTIGNPQNGLFLAGGIAAQMYINPVHPNLLRSTNDADFARLPPMDRVSFEALYNGTSGVFAKYAPVKGSDREGYFIKVTEDHTPFFFHIERPSAKYWERIRHVRERQYSTANDVCIPGTEEKIKVTMPEEIVASKLRRVSYLAQQGKLSPDLEALYTALKKIKFDMPGVIGIDFPTWLERLYDLKDSLGPHFEASPDEGTRFRRVYNGEKDLYDAMLIAKMTADGEIAYDERLFETIINDSNFPLF